MNRIISLFLFIFVANCLTAQYNSPIKNKVTLGVQTTADGLIYRGVAATDTVRKPSIDTMAYMVLDTTTNIIWHYKKATSNAWLRLNLLPSDTASMLTPYWRSGRFSGTLPVANGGTGSATQNFVDLTTSQTIAGNKTFNAPFTFQKAISSFPGSNSKTIFIFQDVNGNTRGLFGYAASNTNRLSYENSQIESIVFGVTNTFDNGIGLRIDTTFKVMVGGDLQPTEALDVNGNARIRGNVGIGSATPTTSGSGITFPSTQLASTDVNTLDDYEEGTWTPAYEGLAGSAGSLAYASGYPRGRYTKIGRLVVATGEIELTNKGSWTSGVRIAGLPFNLSATEVAQGFCIAGFVDFAVGELYLNTRNTGGANANFYFDKTKDNAEREILFTTAVNNNSTFYFSLTYQTN